MGEKEFCPIFQTWPKTFCAPNIPWRPKTVFNLSHQAPYFGQKGRTRTFSFSLIWTCRNICREFYGILPEFSGDFPVFSIEVRFHSQLLHHTNAPETSKPILILNSIIPAKNYPARAQKLTTTEIANTRAAVKSYTSRKLRNRISCLFNLKRVITSR